MKMAKIADYLPAVSVVWAMVSPGDKGETAPIHGVEAYFNNTEKHVVSESVMDEISAKCTIEMVSVIAGGRDKLRERPIYSLCLERKVKGSEGGDKWEGKCYI